jgi:hypothetical protein
VVQPINVHDVPPPISGVAPASNISNLRAALDSDFKGATVSFNIVALTNTRSIVLLRSLTNSILAAKQLENVPLVVGPQSFDDRDPAIVGKQVWYWVQLTSPLGYFTFVGPITITVKQGAPPHAVNWLEVSLNTPGAEEEDSVRVNVICEVFPGTDWSGGIAVFVSNYQSLAATVLIYQDTTETLSFLLKQTGETVNFQVAAVNAAGVLSALSASVSVNLGGSETRPARLTGLSALEGNGFTQVSFATGLEPSITSYKLYRGAYGGPFSGAAVVATIVPTDEPQYSLQDSVVNGGSHTYQWYVTAVNPIGESPASDAILPAVPW